MDEKLILKALEEIPKKKKVPETELTISQKKSLLIKIGDELTGKYIIDNYNRTILSSMFNYFLDLEGKLSLKKGILMIGPIGTGKTLIFRMFFKWMQLLRLTNNYDTIKQSTLAAEYQEYGLKAINRYTWNNDLSHRKAQISHLLIDELILGKEGIKTHYGDSMDVIQALLLERYDIFQQYGYKTHITSNIDVKEFKQKIGLRLYDRFKEMFQILVLNGESKRK